MRPPAGGRRGDPVHLVREPRLYDPAHAAVLLAAHAGTAVPPQVAQERGAVKPQELVAVGHAPLVASPDSGLQFDALPVLLEPGQYFRAVADLQDPDNVRGFDLTGPARVEYDLDDVLTRIRVVELRNSVFNCLVVFEEVGFEENLATGRAWVDVVPERVELLVG